MKLGILLDRLDGTPGGAEAHTLALATRAVAQGDDVVFAAISGEGPAGTTTIPIRVPGRRPAADRAFATDGAAALRNASCDVVFAIRHATDCDVYLPHGGLVQDALAAKDEARGGASAWTQLGRRFSGKHAWFAEAEAQLLGQAEGPRVIAVSKLVADRIRRVYPAAARRTHVVVNGVDAEHFDPAPHVEAGHALRAKLGLDDALVALLVAHHPRLKGVDAGIAALQQAALTELDRPVVLLVVGGAIPKDALRAASAAGVADQVRAEPLVGDMRPWYAASDVLLHPTYHDPCSLVCLEALAMALPVITTPRNGVAEVMGHRGGIVVEEPGNPEALAVALRVLADDVMREGTASDARELALAHPLAERLDRVLDICRAVGGGGG